MRFRIGRTQVTLSFWLVAAAAALSVWDAALLGWILLAVGVHEMAHGMVLMLCGGRVRELSVGLHGILLRPGEQLSPGREAAVLAAGALANLTLALCLWRQANQAAVVQLIVGVFHLLPLPALDGGALLRLLLIRTLPPQRVDRMLTNVGLTVVLCIFAVTTGLYAVGWGHLLLPVAAAGLIWKTLRGA